MYICLNIYVHIYPYICIYIYIYKGGGGFAKLQKDVAGKKGGAMGVVKVRVVMFTNIYYDICCKNYDDVHLNTS
jgi:hypothetical protein